MIHCFVLMLFLASVSWLYELYQENTVYNYFLSMCNFSKEECGCLKDVFKSELSAKELENFILAIESNTHEDFILRGIFTGDHTTQVVVKAFTICGIK